MVYLDENKNSYLYYQNDKVKGTNIPHDFFDRNTEAVITTSRTIEQQCDLHGIPHIQLTEYLGLNKNISLYEIFSYYFEGKVKDDMDMVEAIMKGLVNQTDWCFCLKIGVTFCWFRVQDKKLYKLGSMQFSEVLSNYSVGRFVKRLRYNIAMSGYNIARVKFLFWNEDDNDIEFAKYIFTFDYLYQFFDKINGLKNLKASNIIQLLSKTIQNKYTVTAESFVDSLKDSAEDLQLVQKDGILYSTNIYYKDYNNCQTAIINPSKCTYGIIIDTEGIKGKDGKLTNGISEVGGVIYCKYNNILLNVDTFECDRELLQETLERVVENYKDIANKKVKHIPVLIFGTSDISMLKSSNLTPKLFYTFDFIDCQPFIKTVYNAEDKPTLANIARSIGVQPIYPKHRALNDAKTLFNILAKILQDTNNFAIN